MNPSHLPSAAIPAGSLARTYAYRTRGLPSTPHLRWSFALQAGARMTCPILVAQDRVYVADSAGYVSALDALSGDLLWSFPTDWVEQAEASFYHDLAGVTGVCLDGALGYVASAGDTLYELDLRTGQAVRSWQAQPPVDDDDEVEVGFDVAGMTGLFRYNDRLFLFGTAKASTWCPDDGLHRFDPATAAISGHPIDLDLDRCHWLPTVYHDPQRGTDLLFGYFIFDIHHGGQIGFVALELSGPEVDALVEERWYTNSEWVPNPGPLNRQDSIGWLAICNVPLLDATLYAFCDDVGDTAAAWWRGRRHKLPTAPNDPGDEGECAALVALVPQSGEVKWGCEFPSGFEPIQLAAADHQVFVISKEQVDAVDVRTQQPQWNWPARFQIQQALVADGLVYVLGVQGELVALEVQTGAPRWTWQVEGEVIADASTIDNGTLYVATTQALYALSS